MGRLHDWWTDTRIGYRWEKHFLAAEMGLAAVVAATMAVWGEACGGRDEFAAVLKGVRGTLYPAFVSLFGSLFGFIITAVSVIVTWVGREQFDAVRGRAGYRHLWPTFSSAICWLAAASLASLVAMCIDKDDLPRPAVWYVLAFFVLTACFRLARCVWVLDALIRRIAPPLRDSGSPTARPRS